MTNINKISMIGITKSTLSSAHTHRLSFRSAMDDRSAADESESAASSLQQTDDLSCSVGLSNGGDECVRRLEEDGPHSLSPYFERRSRSFGAASKPCFMERERSCWTNCSGEEYTEKRKRNPKLCSNQRPCRHCCVPPACWQQPRAATP